MTRRPLVCVLGLALAGALTAAHAAPAPSSPAPAQGAFIILNSKLEAEPADVLRLETRSDGSLAIITRDAAGVAKARAGPDIVALVPASWADAAAASSPRPGTSAFGSPVLELTDGQRWPGAFAPDASAAPAAGDPPVRWMHPTFGLLTAPTDLVKRYANPGAFHDDPENPFPPPAPLAPVTTIDAVLLANGDRLRGVVEHFGASLVLAPSERTGASSTLDIARVIEARLANPPAPLALRQSPMLWLSDGSVVRAKAVSSPDRGQVRIDPAMAEAEAASAPATGQATGDTDTRATCRLADIAAAAPNPARIVALADLTTDEPTPVAPLIYAQPVEARPSPDARAGVAPLNADDLALPGPMSVGWALPPGARRLRLTARIADDDAVWAACTVHIALSPAGARAPGADLAHADLDTDHRSRTLIADLGTPTPGDRLVVTLTPGSRGPIQNAVLLTHAILLIDPSVK